jgi:hypothetical protein
MLGDIARLIHCKHLFISLLPPRRANKEQTFSRREREI